MNGLCTIGSSRPRSFAIGISLFLNGWGRRIMNTLTSAGRVRSGGSYHDVVLIIDASNSMEATDWLPTRMRGAQDAARAYVEELVRREVNARVAIIGYGSHAKLDCSLTKVKNSTRILSAIERLDYRGNTNMRAALNLACSSLGNGCHAKHAVFLTDGLNNRRDPVKAAARLQELATLSCVGIGDRDEIDEGLLRRMASSHSDGRPRYRWIGDGPEELIAHFRQLAGRISRT